MKNMIKLTPLFNDYPTFTCNINFITQYYKDPNSKGTIVYFAPGATNSSSMVVNLTVAELDKLIEKAQ